MCGANIGQERHSTVILPSLLFSVTFVRHTVERSEGGRDAGG